MTEELQVRRVLVVDDSPEDRALYARLIASNDDNAWVVETCATGGEAISRIRRGGIDCVLLDHRLPDLTGLEILDQLARRDGRIPVPVVVASGQGSEPIAVAAMKSGAMDYLVKSGLDAPALSRALDEATARHRASERRESLAELATTDALTGLLNRRGLEERLGSEFSRALRYRTGLAALMVDIDHFKRINDDHGHPAGDEVLRSVASVVAACARHSDVVGRFGGEEFLVLLVNTSADEAIAFGERLRKRVGRMEHLAGHAGPLRVTCSVGIAVMGPNDGETESLVERADAALYQAKHAGRDRVVFDESESEGDAA